MSNETKENLKKLAEDTGKLFSFLHKITNYAVLYSCYLIIHFLQGYETRFVATEQKAIQLEQADIKTNGRINLIVENLDNHEKLDEQKYVKRQELRQSYAIRSEQN